MRPRDDLNPAQELHHFPSKKLGAKIPKLPGYFGMDETNEITETKCNAGNNIISG